MKARKDNHSTISGQINGKRKFEVLTLLSLRDVKLEAHVMPTYIAGTKRNPNPLAGHPDGGVRSAFVGDVCRMCGITRADALETVEGKSCNSAAFRKFSMPLDLEYAEHRTAEDLAHEAAGVGKTLSTVLKMERMINDPLADVFA